MYSIFRLIALIILFIGTTKSYSQCHPDDWNALKQFYDLTGGASWTSNTGWSIVDQPTRPPGCDLESMIGVNVNDDGRVFELILLSNNLNGLIPTEIGDLRDLSILWLSNNSIGSSIPPEIGNLDSLSFLSLRDNNITWDIPSEIGSLENLSQLDLSYNSLGQDIPPEIGDLEKLKTLFLNDNNLSGIIPSELGQLAKLTHLRIENNSLLTGDIPNELGNISTLEEIHLQNNDHTGSLPKSLGLLDNLKVLNVENNASMTSSCYFPSLALLCRPQTTVDASGTSLLPWAAFCPTPTTYLCSDCTTSERYWAGIDNNNWNNPNNWDSGCVPTEGTDVYITTTDKQINVNNNVDAEALTLFVGATNDLFIKEQGDLLVGPPTITKDTAIVNNGRIRNFGSISTRNIEHVNIRNNGFLKNGDESAAGPGLITINNTNKQDATAILNMDSLVNFKSIDIIGGKFGIENEGNFNNFRDIDISGPWAHGIYNGSGTFTSTRQDFVISSIKISNTTLHHGIVNSARFINEMKLEITNVGEHGILNTALFSTTHRIDIQQPGRGGLYNVGTFEIQPTANLVINDAEFGIHNLIGVNSQHPNIITNLGSITIDNITDVGLQNHTIFEGAGGHINISNTTIPLEVFVGSTFNVSSTADFEN